MLSVIPSLIHQMDSPIIVESLLICINSCKHMAFLDKSMTIVHAQVCVLHIYSRSLFVVEKLHSTESKNPGLMLLCCWSFQRIHQSCGAFQSFSVNAKEDDTVKWSMVILGLISTYTHNPRLTWPDGAIRLSDISFTSQFRVSFIISITIFMRYFKAVINVM